MPISFTDVLVNYTKSLHEDDDDRTKHLHVTDVSSRCPVGVVLEKAGMVKKNDIGTGKLMRFEVGHITEDYVKKAIKHAGLLEKTQKVKYVWEELNLVGTPDVRVMGDILLEVKSIHPFALDRMDANPEGVVKPHTHYVEQVQMYLEKERLSRPNVVGQLFYFSLDGRTSEHVIEYNQEIVDSVKRRAAVLNECINTRKLPTLPKYFVQEYDKRTKGMKWGLDYRVKYCILDGIHQHCDKKLYAAMEPNTPDQFVSKIEYQAKKANDSGTNPNDAIAKMLGSVEEKDGLIYEPV